MKQATLKKFMEAGNALLAEEFAAEQSALVLIADGDRHFRVIKGNFKGISRMLAACMKEDKEFYRLLKNTLTCVELMGIIEY